MIAPGRKYVVDSNLFIDALRHVDANDALHGFYRVFAPFEYLSAVVAHELESGVRAAGARRRLRRYVIDPFVRRGRVVTPSFAAWQEAGGAIATLLSQGAVGQVTRAFGNDVLLAASCREAGATLVTNNVRDFERVASAIGFTFVPAWPAPE